MAGRPIVIEFAAKTRDFLRGTKDVERSTEDIADSLQDASRDADRFERDFGGAMKDAERAADRSSRKIGQDFDRAGDEIGEVGREAGQEFQQNLGESLASGNVEDILQDTLGGLVGSLKGPLGIASAGLAAVAAIAFNEVRKQAEETAEFVSGALEDLAGAISATGEILSSEERERAYLEWLDEVQDKLAGWKERADAAGVPLDAITESIYFGGDGLSDWVDHLDEIVRAGTTIGGQGNNTYEIQTEQAKEARKLRDLLIEQAEKQGDVLEGDRLALDLAEKRRRKTAETNDETRRSVDLVADLNRGLELAAQRRTVWLDFKTTGAAASYVTRGGANYSPGLVAIDNLHTRNAKKAP